MGKVEFIKWPKIPRYEKEECIYTEKLDGTNACIQITEDGDLICQSRTRIINPSCDNYGFAKWCEGNKDELLKLGPGAWFGEWWGQGIQRGYDLKEKRFSLFYYPGELPTELVHIVPILPVCPYTHGLISARHYLRTRGSIAAPGYMRPEGIVIYCKLTKCRYKSIIDK